MRIKFRLTKLNFGALQRIFICFGGHLRKHRLKLTLSSFSLLGLTLSTLLRPWPLKVVFDYILLPERKSPRSTFLSFLADWDPMLILAAAAGSIILLAGLRGLLNYSHSVLTKIVGHRLIADIRMQLFSHVQRLPQSYHDYRETGELMTRMTSDISLLQDLLVSTIITLGSQLVLIISMFLVMFWLDWQLALITLAAIPFFILAAFRFSWRIKKSARRQRMLYGKIVSSLQETFSGISQVKSYAQENRRERMIGKSLERDVDANVKTTKLTANYSRIVELITAVGTGFVLWMGVIKAIDGQISPGDLLIFLSYLRGVYRPLKQISQLTTKIAKATIRGEKTMELLELQPEVQDTESGLSAKEIKGDIHLEKVTFSYNGSQNVIKDFSCHIPQSKTTLIIGSTGAGKSTIAKLILRLYKPDKGNIIIDGKEITEYRIRSLRKNISPLAQETFLFRTTISENIAFSRRQVIQDEVENAARMVGADEFIRHLPEGYDTLVGEGGLTLSGGQRQRISFARAALRKSPVMIFDEPATGLDVHAEKETKEVLRNLSLHRTLIVITHRLHFLDLADWVIFIQDGKMIEEGKPEEMLERKGAFFQFISTGQEPSVSPSEFNSFFNRK